MSFRSSFRAMKRYILLLLFNLILINTFNIKDASEKIAKILQKYSKSYRFRRSSNHSSNFARNALNVFMETERFGEVLKYADVSECGIKNESYVKRHIHHGLLVDDHLPEFHWDEYKRVYKKSFAHERHEATAKRHWRDNMRHVARHNKQYLAGTQSYALHLNHLSDLHTTDYYVSQILKLIDTMPLHDPAQDVHQTAFQRSMHHPVPRRVDWRTQGFRPRREQQHGCGACYAFAVTHALQAQMYKKHKDWSELSPQQIVDCSGVDGNLGCDGGSLRAALRYVAREGLMLERHYPYIGMKGICLAHSILPVPHIKPRRWAMLPNDESALEKALATIGPLAVGVNASPKSFQLYRSGIYDDPLCTPLGLNHAMLLVGYSPQYWILLNWWGKHWGEDGYMRIRRGFNRCGVARMAAYVEL